MSTNASILMERINRAAWESKANVKWFARLEGWTDPGEQAAFRCIADEVRGQPILDLGVGAGRTVPLLRQLSRDYTAVDYTPALVAACRKKYPDVTVLDGDARDLSRFADHTFKVVVFSFNGIDAVNPEDRRKVLTEVHRVLRSGGLFWFSAHNKRGPGHGEGLRFGVDKTRNPLKLFVRALRAVKNAPRAARNYRRFLRLNEEKERYSIMNASAHNHGLLIHYITLEAQLDDLEKVGFAAAPLVFDNVRDRPFQRGDDTRHAWWLHYVARKP